MERIKKYILFFCSAAVLLLASCDDSPTAPPGIETATVKYLWNDGSGSEIGLSEFSVGELVEAETQGDYSYSGYVLLSWNTAPDGSGVGYAPGIDFEMPAEDLELYGIWIDPDYIDLDLIPGVSGNSYTQIEWEMTNPSGDSFIHNISSFYSATNEVSYMLWHTVYQWAIANGYVFENLGTEGSGGTNVPGASPIDPGSGDPVTKINWNDALKWCNAYSEFSGLDPAYYATCTGSPIVLKDIVYPVGNPRYYVQYDATASGYSLLTEGEWQFLASNRGSLTQEKYSGVEVTDNTNYWIQNMSDSVGEWCFDAFAGYLDGTIQTDYVKSEYSGRRVYREGLVGDRHDEDAGTASDHIGFRIKRTTL